MAFDEAIAIQALADVISGQIGGVRLQVAAARRRYLEGEIDVVEFERLVDAALTAA